MSEIDTQLNKILDKLDVSKLDNIFLIGFSFLSILFGLSNLILSELSHRQILMVGAVIYFLFSFYIGHLRGVLRDNWGHRVFGWIWISLSAGVVMDILIILIMLESGTRISLVFPLGLLLLSESIASYLLIKFARDMCNVMPNIKHYISSVQFTAPILWRYLSPFIDPVIDPRFSKLSYMALLVFFITGVILIILGFYL